MKNNLTVLIVTTKLDPHADAVIDELSALGCDSFRINTEDLLVDYGFALDERPDGEDVFYDEFGRSTILRYIRSAYYRKPRPVQPHNFVRDRGASYFSASEGEALLKTLYSNRVVRWVNDPYEIRRSQVKLPQLRLAEQMGLSVPRTIVTNDPKVAESFCSSLNNQVVCKSLLTTTIDTDDGVMHAYTHKLTKGEIKDNIGAVRYAPTLFQEWIPKCVEIRATVIGREVFSCEIDSQSVEGAQVDWRVLDPQSIPHRSIQLPNQLNKLLIDFVHCCKLEFGAIDLIKTPEGKFVFLENNPNGQWYWVEMLTGLPLARTIAQLLLSNGTER